MKHLRRLGLAFGFAFLCAGAQASALLPTTTFTTAVTGVAGSTWMFADATRRSLTIQAKLTYGSGGTTVDAYVQTSCDGTTTWIDIANFHFTTASAISVGNLSALTPVTTLYTPTDGTIANNTSKDGILCSFLRVKYTSTGTYAGGTTLQIEATGTPLLRAR
jgi:hypothetical protein